jgi:hypothetical protein
MYALMDVRAGLNATTTRVIAKLSVKSALKLQLSNTTTVVVAVHPGHPVIIIQAFAKPSVKHKSVLKCQLHSTTAVMDALLAHHAITIRAFVKHFVKSTHKRQ